MKFYGRFLFLSVVLILTLFMIINPRETVDAALAGIKLWYAVLLPALLPFLITGELMVNTGFVVFLGIVLEPVMRPLFRLPGCSSLVVALGFTSGFPMGAVMTRRLYEEKLLTANEAERLVSFTNNSSPLFIVGAVGVGMLASPVLGYILAAAHYLSNLLIGLIWRFHGPLPAPETSSSSIWKRAWEEFRNYQSPGPGRLLGDAIKNSLNNILAIAGFVIFFSLLTRMLAVTGIMESAAIFISSVLGVLQVDYSMAYALATGFFEITLGTNAAAGIESSLPGKMVIISIIMAFSGCSIIAQVMSIVSGLPIRFSRYLTSRLLQIVLSAIITVAACHLTAPLETLPTSTTLNRALYSFDAWGLSLLCMFGGLLLLLFLVIISLVINVKNHRS